MIFILSIKKNEIDKEGKYIRFSQYYRIYSTKKIMHLLDKGFFDIICFELQSNYLELLVKTPNNKNRKGLYRDRYIPNPLAKKNLYKNMFIYLGFLLMSNIKHKYNLNLNLHPIFYKKLLFKEITFNDIETFDLLTFKYISSLEAIKDKKEFDEKYPNLYFTAHSSADNSVIIELVENGKYRKVSFGQLKRYIKLYKEFLLHEIDDQIKWINTKFLSLLNEEMLLQITPEELEEFICGTPTFEIKYLRERTIYDFADFEHPTIINFWKALESFTEEEKVKYLEFVSGRTRLTESILKNNFYHYISLIDGEDLDQKLPTSSISHCTLYLPNYSSYELLREKLRYAINNCSIDPDKAGEIYYYDYYA